MYAELLTKTPLTPEQLFALTPKQVQMIYMHPRDKDGKPILPAQPATAPANVEDAVAALRALMGRLQIPAKDQHEAEAKLRARYGPPT